MDAAGSSHSLSAIPTHGTRCHCPTCGGVSDRLDDGVPCRSCCAESRARARVERLVLLPLSRRADRFRWWGAAVPLAYIVFLIALGTTTVHFNFAVPDALRASFMATRWGIIGASVFVALQMDVIVRQLAVTHQSGGRIRRGIAHVDRWMPGAALAILALFLPGRIGAVEQSVPLLVLYGVLSTATIAAAITLRYRVRVHARMQATGRAPQGQRHAVWRSARLRRSGALAFSLWLLIPLMIAGLHFTDIDMPYPASGGSVAWQMAREMVTVSLYLSAILWYFAYLDATKHLRRWATDAG